MRWLGPSMRLTGITGVLEGAAVEVLGRLGRGDLTLEPPGGVALDVDAGLRGPLPGVEGNDDGKRGVPFMACSQRPSRALLGLWWKNFEGDSYGESQALDALFFVSSYPQQRRNAGGTVDS